jgi:hypothetical protein
LDRLAGPDGESDHWVKPEIRYIASREAVTRRQEAQGWQYRVFQGKPAMERMQCVDCLRRNLEREQLWSEIRTRARELEADTNEGAEQVYFKALCES